MSDTNSFVELVKFIRSETDHYLCQLDLPAEPTYLYKPLRFVLNGKGKRLRPVLVHLSGREFKANPEDLMKAGAAVELLHNFTLIHDDIMDGDETRHGQPTVHKQFGLSSAILAGDSIFTLGQILIGRVQEHASAAIYAYNRAAINLCEGQAFDLQFEAEKLVSLDGYLAMVEKKTGALLGLCAELGAILGKQNDEICAHLRDYGILLGKAFQVQDDLLEIYSDEEIMGKSLGSDVSAGKQTILTILARSHDGWEDCINTSDDVGEQLNKLRVFFVETGVQDQAFEIADELIHKAKSAIAVLDQNHKIIFNQFTEMILNRTY